MNQRFMCESPIISIIVPVYKVEKYIKECVESIRKQSFSDIEIILVDDGSPDCCAEICDEYAKKDKRVKVIHQKNSGLSSARNAGIGIAQGKFLCFIDSDDYISPHYCEILYDCLVNTNYDFSVCEVERFTDGSPPADYKIAEERKVVSNETFLKLQLSKKSEFGVWNKLYRRELFDRIHFMDGKIHEDVIWSADLAKHCTCGVICTNQPLYYYRQRQDSIVSNGSKKCSPDRIYAGSYLIDCVKDRFPGLYEDTLFYAVNYPWSFIDKIYIKGTFLENKDFMNAFRDLINTYLSDYMKLEKISPIMRYRMKLFSKSRLLYAFNAYVRLLRNYVCRLMGKDPYESEHSI